MWQARVAWRAHDVALCRPRLRAAGGVATASRSSLTCSHQHEGAGGLPAHYRWAALPCFLGLARSTRLTAVHCIVAWLRILCLSCQRRLLPPFTQADDGCWVFPRIRLPRLPTKPTGARPPVLKLGQAVEVRGAHAGAPYPSREAACLFVVQPHTLPLFSEHIWSPAAAAMCTALLSLAAPAVTHLQHMPPTSLLPADLRPRRVVVGRAGVGCGAAGDRRHAL